ncbi:hypothetical protein DPMN_068733 [Dreissena polymorpha]|uniref:Uncharacterized protein n=1 Tax=Dreissena polymorpha TaxID=45954 RepID=A0A9D3Z1Q0_DREPO|nr:hypothetical protein DPMN_068733 [Dreissena polymorpha]
MKTAATLAGITNLRTKFNEYWTTHVTSRVLPCKTAPPPWWPYFSTDQNNFQTQPSYHKNTLLTSKTAPPTGGHTCRVSTRKTAPSNGGHIHEDLTQNKTHKVKTAPPPSGHFDEDWTINVTSKVLTSFFLKLGQVILFLFSSDPVFNSTKISLGKNLLTKQKVDDERRTTHDGRRTIGDLKSSP